MPLVFIAAQRRYIWDSETLFSRGNSRQCHLVVPLDNIDNTIFESEIELLMIKYLLEVEGNMVPGMSRKNKFLNTFFRAHSHLLLVRHPAEGTPNKRRRGYSPS